MPWTVFSPQLSAALITLIIVWAMRNPYCHFTSKQPVAYNIPQQFSYNANQPNRALRKRFCWTVVVVHPPLGAALVSTVSRVVPPSHTHGQTRVWSGAHLKVPHRKWFGIGMALWEHIAWENSWEKLSVLIICSWSFYGSFIVVFVVPISRAELLLWLHGKCSRLSFRTIVYWEYTLFQIGFQSGSELLQFAFCGCFQSYVNFQLFCGNNKLIFSHSWNTLVAYDCNGTSWALNLWELSLI